MLHAWSSQPLGSEKREQLINDISECSGSADSKHDLFDVFLNQSADWSFWGTGVPVPIAEFYDNVLKSEICEQERI